MSGSREKQTKWNVGIGKVHGKLYGEELIFKIGWPSLALRKVDSRRKFSDGDK